MASDRSTWTVGILAEFLDAQQRHNEELVTARYEADQAAIQAALKANDHRLDEMQGFRGAMADQAARKVDRAEFQSEVRSIRAHIDTALAPIEKDLATHGKPNWALFVSMASVVLAIIGGCWLLIGLEISVAINPLALSIEQNKADTIATQKALTSINDQLRAIDQASTASTASDAESRADRGRQQIQLANLEQLVNDARGRNDTSEARFAEKLTEIETQFFASDQIRNLEDVHAQRLLSILWHDTHPNETLPTDNSFHPSISRQNPVLVAPTK